MRLMRFILIMMAMMSWQTVQAENISTSQMCHAIMSPLQPVPWHEFVVIRRCEWRC